VDGLALTLASRAAGRSATGAPVAHLTDAMTANLEAYRLYSLGVAKAQALHVSEAVTLFERAVALDPEFAMAYARIGYAYGIAGPEAERAKPFLERARQLSARLTEKDRLQVEAWYAIVRLDYPTAIQHYRLFINRYPTDIEGHVRLARLLSGEEQNEEAREILRRGLIVDPNSPDAHNLLGGIASLLGRHDEAIAARTRYVELLPREPNAYDSLGLSHQAAGAYDEAIRHYRHALQLDPRFVLAYVHLSNTYVQTGRYREAIDQLQQFLTMAPGGIDRGRGLSALSYLHRARGDLAAAERAGRQALTELPEYADPLFLTLLDQGRHQEAAAIRPLLEPNPRFSGRGGRLHLRLNHYVLGMEALALGQQKQALDLFRQALRYQRLMWFIDPLDTCLADAFLRLRMYDDAIREYGVALRVNPTHGMAHFRLAKAYEGAGRPADALAEYRRFLELWKDADDDIPEVIDARRRLQSRTAGPSHSLP
jgi:tetratricopeptide (TPR) repeat protein